VLNGIEIQKEIEDKPKWSEIRIILNGIEIQTKTEDILQLEIEMRCL
jgi:hypothetical protein